LPNGLIDAETAVPFEEYTELVDMAAFLDEDQAVMDVWLQASVIEDTLGEWISLGCLAEHACTMCWDLYLVRFVA
jgi:hypothetical protein